MPTSNPIVDVIKWFAANFGKDIIIELREALQHQWRRLFAAKPCLVLGAKQTGKSSLHAFLRNGHPYDIVNGEVRAPAPTALVAIVDEKFAPQQGNWMRLKHDVPGDVALRETWAQSIADVRPHGIIYMIDGRHDDAQLARDVQELRADVLSHFESSLGNLAVLHVFLNYADHWGKTPAEVRRRCRHVRTLLDEIVDSSTILTHLRINVSETQLSSNKRPWDEVARAMHRFGTDLE